MIQAAARQPHEGAVRSAEREFLALVDELVAGASIIGGTVEIREASFRKLCAWRESRAPAKKPQRAPITVFEKRRWKTSDLGPRAA
jgi:hypothetical protein